MVKAAVIGATGYTGFELIKILSRHPDVEISHITSESSEGEAISSIYPSLRTICDMSLVRSDCEDVYEEADAVFLCLPHQASMDVAASFYGRGVKVFDLSADYRFNDFSLYEKTYKARHTHPDLTEKSVYGLAEVNRREIETADLVAVPGCYPTSVLIPLVPLVKNGLVKTDRIIADSKSGVSGAGKKATMATHFCEANEDFKPYGIFSHRHKPEMDHILKRCTGKDTDIIFTPHLTPLTRGMLSTIYAVSESSEQEIKDALADFYRGERFVRIIDSVPAVKNVAGTAFIDINVYRQGDNVIIISALDNLMKGASSQAVQCFNIRYGFNMQSGLI